MTKETGLETPADELAKASVTAAVPAPVSVRNVWIVLLAVLATLYALHWAAPVLIPVMIGVMISYALSPLVNAMEKWHIHRGIGAAVLLICLVAGAGWLVFSLGDEAAGIIETLPDAAQKVRKAVRAERGAGESAMEKVQKAATEIEKAASDSSGATAGTAPRGVTRVQIEKPTVNIRDFLWSGTLGALTFIGQLVTVLFFAYFLMAAGDKFRRKLINVSRPRLSEKKVTVEALNEITKQIQRYLLVQLFTSTLVGVVSWLAFAAIGLEHAAIWGIAAGVLNSVPYFGPIVVSGGIALVAFVQFGTFGMALWAAGIALVITTIEGFLLTPWLIGRTSGISAVVVFASVIVGGWLWGPLGLLLGVPIVMIIKTVCDHVEDLQPMGELLGD
jgi:predicted PurR-regulated permease PerM